MFLQQLGRGLRRAPSKPVLTVLDIIGQHRREFRFDVRYRALTGASRKSLVHQIEHGFPFLPSGSQLVLDRVAQRIVLDNVRRQLALRGRKWPPTSDRTAICPCAVPREPSVSWRTSTATRLVDRAPPTAGSPRQRGRDAERLLRRMSTLTHVDDPERAAAYTLLTPDDAPPYDALGDREQRLARMLFFTLWPDRGGFDRLRGGLGTFAATPPCARKSGSLSPWVSTGPAICRGPWHGLQHVPMFSHAHYRREELLAALEWASMSRTARGNITGVAWAEETQTDALMINLRKSEKDFSPTTMYRDYAISPELFHWESQNATSTLSAPVCDT